MPRAFPLSTYLPRGTEEGEAPLYEALYCFLVHLPPGEGRKSAWAS